jgi:hypothetical protein
LQVSVTENKKCSSDSERKVWCFVLDYNCMWYQRGRS